MTTTKRLQANRHNAQKSTGPVTEEGKAAVSMNALKHGLLSGAVLLPDEDASLLADLENQLRAQLRPEGSLEILLVDRMAASLWRLRRLNQVETGIFVHEQKELRESPWGKPVDGDDFGLAFIRVANNSDAFSKLSRYESTIERSLFKALHELQRLQSARSGQAVPPPMAVDVDIALSGGLPSSI